METARRLDAHFEETGKVVGSLHGLPVSIKVISTDISLLGLAKVSTGYVQPERLAFYHPFKSTIH